jgi:hypothetical protein
MSAKQKVYRAFTRKYGIVMHPEATDYVIDFMTRHDLPEADMTQLLEQLALQYIQRTGRLLLHIYSSIFVEVLIL